MRTADVRSGLRFRVLFEHHGLLLPERWIADAVYCLRVLMVISLVSFVFGSKIRWLQLCCPFL